jgi:hypothetical protein
MTTTLSLDTPVRGDPDITPSQVFDAIATVHHAYPQTLVLDILSRLLSYQQAAGLRGSLMAAQMLLETGNFTFTGDVRPEQYNFGGIGATGGGARGHSFASWQEGVDAFVVHLLAYVYGPQERWPSPDRLPDPSLDPRYRNVLQAGLGGSIQRVSDYGNGRWAVDPNYNVKIRDIANRLLSIERKPMPRVFLLAGHHNTSGGNPVEHSIVGELTEEISIQLWRMGIQAEIGTPDGPDDDTIPGDGDFPGTLYEAARQAVSANPPDIFLEVHTEGAGGRRGCFGIYPDWGNDVDVDARDILIPLMVKYVSAATGLPVRGNGVMSEKQTYVGSQGSRLGVFRATEEIRRRTTRLIFEYGAHDSPDIEIIRGKYFNELAGRATASAIAKFLGWNDQMEDPTRTSYFFPNTGKSLERGFKSRFEQFPYHVALAHFGYPESDEFEFSYYDPSRGGVRTGVAQVFERCVWFYDPSIPADNTFHIECLPHPINVVARSQAHRLGVVRQGAA